MAFFMAGETHVTVVGNLTADPELRFTPAGAAVASFTVASTPRMFDKNTNAWVDGDALFMRCSIWREAAEHVAESLVRGARVIVTGRLKQTSWEKDGQKRTAIEMDADEIGPSLKYATAQVTKATSNSGGGNGGGGNGGSANYGGGQQPQQQSRQTAPTRPGGNDPWGTNSGGNSYDGPPF